MGSPRREEDAGGNPGRTASGMARSSTSAAGMRRAAEPVERAPGRRRRSRHAKAVVRSSRSRAASGRSWSSSTTQTRGMASRAGPRRICALERPHGSGRLTGNPCRASDVLDAGRRDPSPSSRGRRQNLRGRGRSLAGAGSQTCSVVPRPAPLEQLDAPAVGLDDGPADGEPHPEPAGLGGEEGLEEPRAARRRPARPRR